jgi:uncharacterized protein (DUF1330 family)
MAAYVVANYRVTNPEAYTDYPPAVVKTLLDHGAEILAADYDSEILEGATFAVTIILKFHTKEAARAWYNSPEYQKIIHYRTDNSEGSVLIADEYEV